MICKFGAPTQDGGKSSSIRIANSSTGPTTRSLMSEEVKTKKDNKLEFGAITEADINNGKLFILIRQRAHKLRVSPKTLDSISTDHSTSFQIFHLEEWLNALVPTTLHLRNGETIVVSNGTSMVSLRPLRAMPGNLTLLISNLTVDQQMSDALLPTQDGGKCGDLKEDILSTRKERYLRFKTKVSTLIWRIETSRLPTEEKMLDNNSRSSMLMNTKSQRRVNLTKTSDFTSRETSMLYHKWDHTDTLI
jgi:hypothetical protein